MSMKKIVFIGIGSFIGLLLAATAYILLVIDPNEYKSEIISQVKTNTGREVQIDGDISWRIFPNIGVTLGQTRINNPEGFPEVALLELEAAQVDLAFFPLLSKRIEIGTISIQGLSVAIMTRADGVSNLDTPAGFKHETDSSSETSGASSGAVQKIEDLVIDGIEVSDATIVIEDLKAKTKQVLSPINFSLGKLKLGEVVPLSLSIIADTGDVTATIKSSGEIRISTNLTHFELIDLTTEISLSGDSLPDKQVDIKHQMSGYFDASKQEAGLDTMTLSLLDMEFNGKMKAKLTTKPRIEFELKTGAIDVDSILSRLLEGEKQKKTESGPVTMSWMNSFNMKGLLAADSIEVSNLTVSDIQLPIELNNGVLTIPNLSADLYEGKIVANANINGRTSMPTYSLKTDVSNVQALPLIKDMTEKELVSGVAKISLDINGKGLDDQSIRKNSTGSGSFSFTDGAIHGVNVAELIRTTYAKVKGQTIEATDGPLQTDFASFTGSFNLGNGVVKNSDLKLLSPLLRVSGNGSANIINETVNYNLQTAVVGTLEGQGGKPITDLKNISIPLKIRGAMTEPDISLDMDRILKDSFKKKAKDKLKDKLKDIFG